MTQPKTMKFAIHLERFGKRRHARHGLTYCACCQVPAVKCGTVLAKIEQRMQNARAAKPSPTTA